MITFSTYAQHVNKLLYHHKVIVVNLVKFKFHHFSNYILDGNFQSVIPLSTQLNYFEEYVGKLKRLVGEKEGNKIVNNSLYLVVAGSNDLANTYFTIGFRQKQYDINSYTDLMVDKAADFIQVCI